MAGVGSVGAVTVPNQLVSQPQTAPPKSDQKTSGSSDSIIDIGDLPGGIIDIGDLPGGIIDVGDLPDGVSKSVFDKTA